MNRKKIGRIVTVALAAVTVLTAVYIMVRGLGLQRELDFGAGAYYYADIPDFDKYTGKAHFRAALPYGVYVALFLAWGALMYAAWKWIDKK